jgi:fibronectin type 3 domain-containing protein
MKIAFLANRANRIGTLLLAGTLLLGGCGYKTMPVPPENIVPKAIDDLRYTVDEKGVTLTWSYPVETIKGTDLTDIASFEVYRAVTPLDSYCATCPIPFGEPIIVPGGTMGGDGRRKGIYESALLRSGDKYFFKVRSRTSWWAASADSNIVTFVWHMPAKAPTGLQASGGDRTVRLQWQPAAQLMDGQPLDLPVQYQVLRSLDKKSFEKVGPAGKETRYTDASVQNGQNYSYKIQSVLQVDGNAVDGGVSEVTTVTPVDLTPPESPAGVTVIATSKGFKIFWENSTASDLQGYHVYRRAADQKKSVKIGDVESIYTIYEDNNAPAGGSFYYSVTAYDNMKPANESKPSAEATVRQ